MTSLIKICVVIVLVTVVNSTPTTKESNSILNDFIPENFRLSDYVDIKRNDYQNNDVSGRSDDSVENKVEDYMKSHDFTLKLPVADSSVTFQARNLDKDELDLKLRFSSGTGVEARKSKLKKLFVPIFVFILIKAMVLIPLALGVLAIKTWNALQLSFVSFVVAIALGVWQLCKKVIGDSQHPHVIAHAPEWDAAYNQYAARSFNEDAQKMAYSAYVQ